VVYWCCPTLIHRPTDAPSTYVQHFLACIYWKVSIETCSALKGKCPEELYDDAHGQDLDDLFTGTGEYGLEQFACGWEHCQFSPPPVFEPKDESDMVATWDRLVQRVQLQNVHIHN
jgi:hypothetical protein